MKTKKELIVKIFTSLNDGLEMLKTSFLCFSIILSHTLYFCICKFMMVKSYVCEIYYLSTFLDL